MASSAGYWKRKFREASRRVRAEGLRSTVRYAGRRALYETSPGRLVHGLFFRVFLQPRFRVWRFLHKNRPLEVPCLRPFSEINIESGGRCHVCCPAWLPIPVGNLKRNSIEGAFNSAIAQSIRIGLYTGRRRKCCAARCVILSSPSFRPLTAVDILRQPLIPEEDKKRILRRELRFPEGPSRLSDNIPVLCNIRCEFCGAAKRNGFDADGRSRVWLGRLQVYAAAHAPHLRHVAFGGGEPLVDPGVRGLLTVLRTSAVSFQFTSNLNEIDEPMKELLRGIRIHRIHVSLNAASRETYERLCRGGRWESVLRNLDFILRLRDSAAPRFSVGISMVVTKWNYREVADFAALGASLKVDRVIYHPLYEFPGNEPLRLDRREQRELAGLLEAKIFAPEQMAIDLGALRACGHEGPRKETIPAV